MQISFLHKLGWRCAAKNLAARFLLILSLFSASCTHTDEKHENELQTFNALRNCTANIQVSAIDNGLSNSNLLERIESELSSAGQAARELRSLCDTVWFSTNLDNWLLSVSDHQAISEAAMVAEYRVGNDKYLIGVTFDGKVAKQDRAAGSGFTKVDLNSKNKP